MSLISKIFTLASGGASFADNFVAFYGHTSNLNTNALSLAPSSNPDALIVGGSNNQGFALKINYQGEIIDSVSLSAMYLARDSFIDSDGSIYVQGMDSGGLTNAYVTKLNSSLQVQWAKDYEYTFSSNIHGFQAMKPIFNEDYLAIVGAVTSSSGSVYGLGIASVKKSDGGIGSSGVNDFIDVRHPSPNCFLSWRGIDFDSSSNLYIGATSQASNPSSAAVARVNWNSSTKRHDAVSFFNGTNSASGAYNAQSLCQESGNIYQLGYHDDTAYRLGSKDCLLNKYTTSGGILFEKGFGISGQAIEAYSVVSDGSYVYSLVYGSYPYIVAHDTSGNLSWQRKITGTGVNATMFRDMRLDANDGKLVLAGRYTGTTPTQAIVMRVPTDGSATGNYGPITYAATTDISAYNMNPSNNTFSASANNYNPNRSNSGDTATSFTPSLDYYS